jgi:MOSC domain-containing protein YiiM
MKILSIQVGEPRKIVYAGKEITTAIFKSQVSGPVKLSRLNLAGDRQADLTVHGGTDKAVYAFGKDAYSWWETHRPAVYGAGAFGENLTIDQLLEDKVCVGDTYEVGDALIQVTQPRLPCYKLEAMYADPSILKTFMKSKRPGIYFRVLREGTLDSGQSLKLVDQEPVRLSVSELFLFSQKKPTRDRAREILSINSLNENWRRKFESLAH